MPCASIEQARGKTRPANRAEGPLELLGAFHADRLVDDLRARARTLIGLAELAVGQRRDLLLVFDDLFAVGH
jgi:hypothetical protein